MIRAGAAAFLLLAACAPGPAGERDTGEPLPDDVKQTGTAFLQPETRALQEDDFENPGFLWIDRGDALFHEASGTGESCASCHEANGAGLKGAAAHYPKIDGATAKLFNLEARINACRTSHQDAPALAYESDELLALTAYVANLSRGEAVSVDIGGAAATYYQQGEDYFFTRRGQLNLSCHQCHDENWGKRLRGDTISQGHGNGFPAYRLEWQALGSLHRRLSDCDEGVRAEPYPLGSDIYTAVELYLASRAGGLPVETPAVRR